MFFLPDIYHRRLHKLSFYLRHVPLGLLPHHLLRKDGEMLMRAYRAMPEQAQAAIQSRVDYYHRINEPFALPSPPQAHYFQAKRFHKTGNSSYYYDMLTNLRYWAGDTEFYFEPGDVTHIPPIPTFVKSRPISDNNQNAILLKLDSVRHFYIYPDKLAYNEKKDRLIWRGAAHQPQRIQFLEKHHAHPLCDVGCVHQKSAQKPYHANFMSVPEQLQYKFILSIEGNDVATNLKWILASQSLCFMTAPKFETWLMEGRLIPNVHYVHLEDDYSDLDEKLHYYQAHPEAAQAIIREANAYMQPFFNPLSERITSYLVMEKYRMLSQQAT